MPTLNPNRREFLKSSTVAAAGASLAGSLSIARSAHASVDDTLRSRPDRLRRTRHRRRQRKRRCRQERQAGRDGRCISRPARMSLTQIEGRA